MEKSAANGIRISILGVGGFLILFPWLIYGITLLALGISFVALFITNAVYWVVWDSIREKTPREKKEERLKKAIKEKEKDLDIAHLELQKKRLQDEIERVEKEAGVT